MDTSPPAGFVTPPPASPRRHVALTMALAAGALAVGVAAGWLAGLRGWPMQMPHPRAQVAPAHPPAPSTLDGGALLAPAQRDALAALLLAHDGFAHDLAFLLAASLRDRCAPAHAHELARMAVAAHLPVLDGATVALQGRPELRGAAYALIRRLAATAPCGRPLDVAIGRYRATLDPERYAAAFPDSYFDPGLDAPPPDVAGRDLGERGADPCTSIVYAVLPLDAERAWECLGLRATLRRRLQETCAAGLHDAPAADAQTEARLAASIHDDLERLPAMCR